VFLHAEGISRVSIGRHEAKNPRRGGGLERDLPAMVGIRPWSGALELSVNSSGNHMRGGSVNVEFILS
jgi:hypothetical protein